MVAQMTEAGGELISIYYGEGISETDADALKQMVQTDFGDYDVEMQSGGQPIYYYIVSVE
jgi:dihydroxyacetone kinase-like predicted kinase